MTVQEMVDIDEINRKIIDLLTEDSRRKVTDIAKICGISATAIQNRIKNLQKKGIIVKRCWNVDWSAFGYKIPLTICINVKPKKIKDIRKIIEENLIIISVDNCLGVYNFLIFAYAKNIDNIKNTEKKIRKIKGVTHFTVNIWNINRMSFKTQVSI